MVVDGDIVAGTGVLVTNSDISQGVTVDVDNIHTTGIAAQVVHEGSGDLVFTADGSIASQEGAGVNIQVLGRGGDIVAQTGSVTAGDIGIVVRNLGTGTTDVVSTGSVTGGVVGILAEIDAAADTFTLEAVDVTGGDYGIALSNDGVAGSITIEGDISGGIAAIGASGAAPLSITLNGATANASGQRNGLAITSDGGAATILNNASLTGRLTLSDADDVFVNNGIWATRGFSDFGGGNDLVRSTAGSQILVADNASTIQQLLLPGLESFEIGGTLVLRDGGLQDSVATSGDIAFQSGSTLSLDVGGTLDLSDKVLAAGAVTIEEGVTLDVGFTGPLVRGKQHRILTADGGLTGQFDFADQTVSAFFRIEDTYDANNAYIELLQFRAFADAALTDNQVAVGGALDTQPINPLTDAVGLLENDELARDAFDQLSGEIHAVVPGMLIEDSRYVREALLDRMVGKTPASSSKFGLWADFYAGRTEFDGNGNAASVDGNSSGLVVGADYRMGDTLRVGIVGSVGSHAVDLAGRASSADVENALIGAYAAARFDGFVVNAGVTHAWNDVGTERSIAFDGFADAPTASYDATTTQAFGEAGYELSLGNASLTPFAGLSWVGVSRDAFAESESDASLQAGSFDKYALFGTLGMRGEAVFDLGGMELRANGLVGWRHVLDANSPSAELSFGGADTFTVFGAPLSEDTLRIEAGVQLEVLPSVRIGAAYTGNVGSAYESHGARVGVSIDF